MKKPDESIRPVAYGILQEYLNIEVQHIEGARWINLPAQLLPPAEGLTGDEIRRRWKQKTKAHRKKISDKIQEIMKARGFNQEAVRAAVQDIKELKYLQEEANVYGAEFNRGMMDFTTARVLHKNGEFSTIGEAVDWIEAWRNKETSIRNLPPGERKEALKNLDATWKKKIPPGSAIEKEIHAKIREMIISPEEMERIRNELEETKKELERVKKWPLLGKEPIQPDFEAVKKMKIVPVDPVASALIPYIIPDMLRRDENILDEPLKDGSRVLKYRKVFHSHRITHTWIIPPELAKEEIPRVGNIARTVLNLTYAFCVQQLRNGPEIAPGEMLSLLGEDFSKGKGGKYPQLYNIYRTLAYGTYEIERFIGRKWVTEEISNILSVRFERGENKRKIKFIRPYFANFFVETLNRFLLGEEGGRYIGVPMELLRGGLVGYSGDVKNFVRKIYSYRNLRRSVCIQYMKLFGDPKWLGWTEKKLERARAADLRRAHEDIIQAINDLSLGTYKMEPRSVNMKKKNELLSWKMIFRASNMLRLKHRQFKYDPKRSIEFDMIDRITDWHCQPGFQVKKDREGVREQVLNTVDKYGLEAVQEIFNSSENPKEFWNLIKRMKGERKKISNL